MKDQGIISSAHPAQNSLIAQLRGRLIITVGILVCCIVLSSAVSIIVVMNQQQLGTQKLTIHQGISDLLQAMVDQETGLRGYVTTNNTVFLEPLTSGRAHYSTALQELKNQTTGVDFSATSQALTQVDAQANNWTTTFADAQIADMQNGRLATARSTSFNDQGKALFDTLRNSITQLETSGDTDLGHLQMQENTLNFFALAGSLLLTIIVIIWLWRTFIHFTQAQRTQLARLKETTTAFGAGDLSARVEHVTDVDLNDLGHSFNTMADTLQAQQIVLRDRDILEQVSHLNTVLTSSLDLTEIVQNFLGNLLIALDVQIGILYLYAADQKQLHLFSSRGLHHQDIQATFELGEGSVGQTALERRLLMLPQQQEPLSDWRIQTILGPTLPSNLYHLPLLHGNDLLGVLVIGSLYPMREQARNVLNVVASNLSSAISNAQAYMRIQNQTSELVERAREQERSNQALRQQRDELTVLNQALEEANRVRSQFLSTMSHELRTPLTSVIGFSQILLRTSTKSSLTTRQHDNVERILKNAEHLLTLINGVLDLAKIEAGRMDINVTEVNLKELLTTLVDEIRSLAIERNLHLSVNIADDITTIESDPTKLRQVILNLVSNALKFTKEGSVTVSATRRTTTHNKTETEQIAITVKDTGIGILPEQQERIFEAFYQVDHSNTRSYGGTGLGLSIVRELTTLLGGIVELESQPDQGTTFTIVLPVRTQKLKAQSTYLNIFQSGRATALLPDSMNIITNEQKREKENNSFLIIAIDDNPDVLQLITTSLEQSPYRIVGVQDPTQAIPIIQELHPHAITLDIMMPKMNGWQILHQLKSNPITASIPVILLTVLEDRSAGYVLGADEYLVKPVARDALLATLQHLTISATISEKTPAAHQQQENSSPDSDQLREHLKHILLVNSAPHVQKIIERLVAEKGYTLKISDGKLDLISIIEQAPPDLLMILVQLGQQTGELPHPADINNESSTLTPPLEAKQHSIDEENI
ncbi:MAG TPA: ATP-binding protein [Ktedonobacteraceae bacterium]